MVPLAVSQSRQTSCVCNQGPQRTVRPYGPHQQPSSVVASHCDSLFRSCIKLSFGLTAFFSQRADKEDAFLFIHLVFYLNRPVWETEIRWHVLHTRIFQSISALPGGIACIKAGNYGPFKKTQLIKC